MRDVDSVVFRPVAERRTRLWAWRVPGRETLGEAGTQSLATSQDHPPIPHLLWGCPAPPPGLFPQLGRSGGGDPPAQTPPWARSSAFAWLLGRAASLAPRRGGLEGERRTEKQIRGWGLAQSCPALTARAPTLCCLPALDFLFCRMGAPTPAAIAQGGAAAWPQNSLEPRLGRWLLL